MIKRKRTDAASPGDRRVGNRNQNLTPSKNLTHSEPSKRPKTGIFFQRDSSSTVVTPPFILPWINLSFRNRRSIVLSMAAVIGRSPAGFTVPPLVFVVISMTPFKLFNVAKAIMIILHRAKIFYCTKVEQRKSARSKISSRSRRSMHLDKSTSVLWNCQTRFTAVDITNSQSIESVAFNRSDASIIIHWYTKHSYDT